MPRFPKRERDIVSLANAMADGYTSHAADFPSANLGLLSIAGLFYMVTKTVHTEAAAAARVATEQKDANVFALVAKMKAEPRKSEVDVGDESQRLEYIGWGPKAAAAQSSGVFDSGVQSAANVPDLPAQGQ